ncbi:DUF4123 domain-containing protein [Vibrio algivorus]|uniref:DUF4123 domain-containing protein n=1 Tax=Vibrio algivorus TaxID=1667024 RepID=A0A557PFN1_9VIBR|nr:DUF4123 domain-containing protein [Vibrio algivorus]TVO39451.1 DUF4123 domain-containing protein [Vibrio algivorus]
MVSIPLSDWLHQQTELNKTVYAIVDPQSAHQPHVAFCQCDGQDGAPLLSPRELSNAPDGPWLLPANTAFMQWWQQDEHASSGILIATDFTYDEVRAHFASLFQAALFGEVVFFPFYKPVYLGDMLPRLEQEELTILLDKHSVLLKHQQKWQAYQAPRTPVNRTELRQIQTAPWWVIKSHHLDNAPNMPLLSVNVESWMWQHQPKLMQMRQQQNKPDFKAEFQRYYSLEEEAQPFIYKVLKSAVTASFGVDFASSRQMSEILKDTENDEMLYGLKYTFTKIQGYPHVT